ncbi:MAG: hypothetical protein ABEK01_00580 [Candidatus Nanohaloarchaea archaeon]
MEVRVKPAGSVDILEENLEKRVESVEREGEVLVVETEDPSIFDRVPGVEYYEIENERTEGLKGRPVQEPVYARLESREDVARALLATINGYDLRVLNTDREWDLKLLKRFNPDIKHLKFDEPRDSLGIEKSLDERDGMETVDVDVEERDLEKVYGFLQE